MKSRWLCFKDWYAEFSKGITYPAEYKELCGEKCFVVDKSDVASVIMTTRDFYKHFKVITMGTFEAFDSWTGEWVIFPISKYGEISKDKDRYTTLLVPDEV